MKYLVFLFLFIFLLLLAPLSPQEKVVEQVSVDWWVLPLFALDKDGNSILDLKNSDVELRVNNRKMTEFTLYKRAFSVADASAAAKKAESPPLPQAEKEKLVFLLFDIAFTTNQNFTLSKQVAKNLVMKSEDNTMFSIVVINPLTGPEYVGGPLSDKRQIVKMIDEKITWDPQTKSIGTVMSMAYGTQVVGDLGHARLEGDEIRVLQEQRSSSFRKANERFFQSFATLYHALNSIRGNKYIYLFSEGITLYARQVVMHAMEEYWFFIKQTANYLGRCGAVLFIINPAGELRSSTSIGSGEDSLRFLARESGGKYMEGEEKLIDTQIENMSRAYYEIAFPDQDTFKEGIRQVTIRSLRKGVNIHTLLNLERNKQYSEMNDMEREVLVLNLLNPSPLYYSPLKTSHLKMEKISEKEDDVLYRLKLPDNFKGIRLDMFKVKEIRTDENTNETSIDKEQITPTTRPLEITVKKKDDPSQRIVLVNQPDNMALVQGIFDAQSEKESILTDKAASFKEQIDRMKPAEITELNRITTNAMSYCTRLADAAFHYICKETVSEVLDDIEIRKSERTAELDSTTGTYRPDFRAQDDIRAVKRKLTNKYVNDYQLISNKGQATEQRKLIKGTVKKIAGKEALLRLDAFISKKTSLTPLSLLGPGLQDRFYFRFVKYDTIKGVKTAIIESFPKDPEKTQSIYGRLWVDLEDFSIVRISVNPVSIGGYSEILKRAQFYNSKLNLTCDIDFFKKHNGIRFPTEVLIRETYSGGAALRKIVGQPVWERSKTTYTFSDFQFFEVEAAASEEEVKK